MMAALTYLLLTTWRNRFVTRCQRLKQPKYLVGAIVGGAYFYFYFFRWLLPTPGAGKGPQMLFAGVDPTLLEFAGAGLLAVILLGAWIFPSQRAALTFTEAEVAFLFPAPISRRTLIHFKLLRSQLAILVTVLFLSLLSARHGSWLVTAIHAGGWWLALSTLNLHFLGASLARTWLLDHGLTNWQRRGFLLGLVGLAAGGIFLWARQSLPAFSAAEVDKPADIAEYFQALLTAGPLPYLLAPFRLVVKPYFAADLTAFALAAGPATLLLLVHYFWVIRINVSFEEASLEASRKLAEKVAAVRAGNWQSAHAKHKAARSPFRLKPVGPPVLALLWKNLIGAGSIISPRLILILLAVALGLSVGFRGGTGQSGWPMVITTVAAALAGWSLFFGPQVLRQDFRREIPQMDLLKALPLPGWQIALGQILTPVVLLTAIQWLLVVIAIIFGLQTPPLAAAPALVVGIGLSALLLLPCLDLVSLIIPNAAVLLFPAWFHAGKDAPHGIEATGQRIIFALGQLLALIVAIVPAAILFALGFFLLRLLLPLWAVIPLAAVAAAVALLVTGGAGVYLLGRLFERFDLSSEAT